MTTSARYDERTRVLVVGGGPVGLSTAMFLTRKGVQPIVVERRAGLSTVPRATGLHARTLELFRENGLERQVAERGMEMVGAGRETERVGARTATPTVMLGGVTLSDYGNAIVLESHDLQYEQFTPSRAIWCGQDLYEPLLLDAGRSGGADVRFETEFVSLEQDDDGVTAVVAERSTGDRKTIRAEYLIAADGVHSPIRTLLGIGQRSHGSAGDILSIIFRARIVLPDDAPGFTWFVVFHPDVMGLLLVMGRDRWMLSTMDFQKRGYTAADFTQENCVRLVRTATGFPDLEVEVESARPWKATHMVADNYRLGRVFLAGDACHAHPPAGGFGVNAGIQDGHNLAWKLAAVLHGWADESLLDTYEAERLPVGAATADQAWLLQKGRLQGLSEQEQDSVRDILPVTGGYHYRTGAVIGADADGEIVPRTLEFTGEPGSRVPHVWLERAGARLSTLDLVGHGFVLIAGPDGSEWSAAGGRVAAELAIPLHRHRIGGDLTDPDDRWPQACGVSTRGALLIRPDGFVAWRATGTSPDPRAALSDALRDVLGRTTTAAGVGRP